MYKFLIFLLVVLICQPLYSQKEVTKKLNKNINVSVWGQLWGTYSLDQQRLNDASGELETVDDRADVFLRRARVFLKGQPLDNLKFTLQLYYDRLGQNRFNNIRGGSNDANLGIWDAFVSYSILNNYLNLTAGYFRPQVGRESITSATQVNSFEKAFTQNYQRDHAIGRPNGRETGLNLGGLALWDNFGINYNFGFFDSNHGRLTGDGAEGFNNAYIYSGRVVFMIGDPEMDKYKIGYKINYFGDRKGLSVAVNGTYSGETDLFDENTFIGADLLFNWNWLALDAEYDVLSRTFGDMDYTDVVWHVRAGYTIPFDNFHLEPSVLYNKFEGDENSMIYPNGTDEAIDLGVNFYLYKNNLKLSGHYILNQGEPRSKKTDGTNFDLGDVVCMGLQFNF